MARLDPLCQFAWHPFGRHLRLHRVLSGMAMRQFRGYQHKVFSRYFMSSLVIIGSRISI